MPCTEWIPTKQTGSICRQHELPSTEQNNTEQDITKQNTSCCLQVLPEHLKFSFETRHKPQDSTRQDRTGQNNTAQGSTKQNIAILVPHLERKLRPKQKKENTNYGKEGRNAGYLIKAVKYQAGKNYYCR